jgi:hypothetical protein
VLNWLKRKDEFDLALDRVSAIYTSKVGINLKLKRIDGKAIKHADEWYATGGGAFNWREVPNEARFDSHKRLVADTSMWVDGQLCGLMIGRKSRAGRNLSIFYIEGRPNGPHPLSGQVFQIVDMVAQEYASILPGGINEIRIVDPLPELVEYYERFGYHHTDKVSDRHKYSVKTLKDGGKQ